MSQLKEKITNDMKEAMRAKDSQRLGTIRLLLAALKQKEVDERVNLDDAIVVAIIDKLVKQRNDSIAAYQKARRDDLAELEQAELTVLQTYLPARLSHEAIASEVQLIVENFTAQHGHHPLPSDMGKLMNAAKEALAGKADMAYVSSEIKRAIAQ